MNGCSYMLTEKQIKYWISLFGDITSKIAEGAEEDKEDGTC